MAIITNKINCSNVWFHFFEGNGLKGVEVQFEVKENIIYHNYHRRISTSDKIDIEEKVLDKKYTKAEWK